MSAARVLAQAKVNLFLRVLAREAGGYHQLETLFQRLELGDDVVVRTEVRGRALDCTGADVGPVERNLAWRAALAYAGAAGWPRDFAIEIDKRIPVGGGLGGGSADAAAVLRALDALAPEPLPAGRLLQLALGLGADVPFLVGDSALALAWGRGERLLALPPLPARRTLLLRPPVGVPTADAYRWLGEDRGDFAPEPRVLAPARLASWAEVVALAGNDFEAPVTRRLPEVAVLADARPLFAPPMPPGVVPPLYAMSGSGSTWFLVLTDERVDFTVGDAEGWRATWTRTAERVVEVERIA
ncbi:MAG TPA: 4-(cytidine 5'-diphospho)-2-C-methyl-D-erythritol kinase [Gemmatimonadaceae bacterium]